MAGAVEPTVTLLVGFMGMAGLVVGPVAVALINRPGRLPEAPDIDLTADLDDTNDRLVRELRHALDDRDRLYARVAVLEAELDRLRGSP